MEKYKAMSMKRKAAAGVLGVIVILAVSIFCYFCYFRARQETEGKTVKEDQQTEITGESNGYSGTMEVSKVAQNAAFQLQAVPVTVEEVFAAAGDTVTQGQALYRLTEESLAAIQEYYESEEASAEKELETAKLNQETGILEAEYTREQSQSEAGLAQEVYQASREELENQADAARKEYSNAMDQIHTYAENLSSNTYYTESGVEEAELKAREAKAARKTSQADYEAKQKEYQILNQAVAEDISALNRAMGQDEQEDTAEITAIVQSLNQDYTAMSQAASFLEEAKKKAEQAEKEEEQRQSASQQAKSQYQQLVSQAEQKKEQLEKNLDKLKSACDEAEQNLALKKASLENEYSLSVLEGEYAQTAYESTLRRLQQAVDSAREKLDSIQEEKAALAQLNNGVICASQAGTLAAVYYEPGDIMKDSQPFVTYYDTGYLIVPVEIPQETIGRLSVGDTVRVRISGSRKTQEGTVHAIASAATEGAGGSAVTYRVDVMIDNRDNTLTAGSSAQVLLTEEDIQENSTEQKRPEQDDTEQDSPQAEQQEDKQP